MAGFELTENFDHPYLARTPADFWRRWNISLSTWFRDYVYIPLGGSRRTGWLWARNVIVTFLLSGLWHGASWNYVLWGLYHGVLLVHHAGRTDPASGRRRGAGFGAPRSRRDPADCRHVRADAARLAAVPRDRAAGDRPRSASRAVEQLTRSSGRPGSTCSCSRSAIRFRCGCRASGSSCTAACRAPKPRCTVPRSPCFRAAACGAAFAAILVLRSRTSLDFIYFQF